MIVFIIILFMLKKMAIVPALLDSPTIELCPKLCWHNLPNPSGGLPSHSMGEGGGGELILLGASCISNQDTPQLCRPFVLF